MRRRTSKALTHYQNCNYNSILRENGVHTSTDRIRPAVVTKEQFREDMIRLGVVKNTK
jgi:hypothetical protein